MLEKSIKIADRQFVSAAVLAEMLHVHKRTILSWAATHRWPVIAVGQMRLFDLADISDWLDQRKRPPAT